MKSVSGGFDVVCQQCDCAPVFGLSKMETAYVLSYAKKSKLLLLMLGSMSQALKLVMGPRMSFSRRG
jgi:hypothetical protein